VCDRTPTESVYGHVINRQLRDLIQEASKSDFVLMWDFSCKGIDWINNYCDNTSVDSRLFLECVNKCFVTQHVITTDNSTLDLILSRDPNMVDNFQVNGYFNTSDHKILSYNLNITKDAKYRTDYKRMNIIGAQEELHETNGISC